jgi:hypothetical protein
MQLLRALQASSFRTSYPRLKSATGQQVKQRNELMLVIMACPELRSPAKVTASDEEARLAVSACFLAIHQVQENLHPVYLLSCRFPVRLSRVRRFAVASHGWLSSAARHLKQCRAASTKSPHSQRCHQQS